MGMGLFLSVLMVLSIFNIGYCIICPTQTLSVGIGVITGFLAIVIPIGILSGFSALTVSLSDKAQQLLFVTIALINILFQIQIPINTPVGFSLPAIPIGMGLLSNMFLVFAQNDAMGLGFIICTILGLLALFSGLQMASGTAYGSG